MPTVLTFQNVMFRFLVVPTGYPAPQIDYPTLAHFRRVLRSFLHFSAKAARKVGLTPQHYQALLALKAAESDAPFTIGQLADELLVRHHSAVELVDRLVARNFVVRVTDSANARRVRVVLTATGETVINSLAATHRAELRRIGPEMRKVLGLISHHSKSPPRAA